MDFCVGYHLRGCNICSNGNRLLGNACVKNPSVNCNYYNAWFNKCGECKSPFCDPSNGCKPINEKLCASSDGSNNWYLACNK